MPHLPLLETAAALRAGTTKAADLQADSSRAFERLESTLAAYKTWNGDGAKRAAALADTLFAAGADVGPLQGIPISVKDLYGVRGLPVFAGSPRRVPAKWENEGPIVAELRRSLAVITGKTHTVEFALGLTGTNSHWGAPRNPWDDKRHRAPGGSSSGAGVSLWQGTARIALGTDTAASVRAPASFTGVVALKTTKGRWSTEGIVPLSTTLDTPGPLTLSADDLAYAFAALDPEVSRDATSFMRQARGTVVASWRIGVCETLFADCDPGVAEAVNQALKELERAGARLIDYKIPNFADVLAFYTTGSVAPAELTGFLASDLPDWFDTLDPSVRNLVDPAKAMTATEYISRLNRIASLRDGAASAFDTVDFIACPTVSITPPAIGTAEEIRIANGMTRRALRNLSFVNLLGWCAISMPAGLDASGMPAGLQLVAPAMADAAVVAAAVSAERVLGSPRDRLGTPPLVKSEG